MSAGVAHGVVNGDDVLCLCRKAAFGRRKGNGVILPGERPIDGGRDLQCRRQTAGINGLIESDSQEADGMDIITLRRGLDDGGRGGKGKGGHIGESCASVVLNGLGEGNGVGGVGAQQGVRLEGDLGKVIVPGEAAFEVGLKLEGGGETGGVYGIGEVKLDGGRGEAWFCEGGGGN